MLIRIKAQLECPHPDSIFDRSIKSMVSGTRYNYNFLVRANSSTHRVAISVFVEQGGRLAMVTCLDYAGPLPSVITGQIVGRKSCLYQAVPDLTDLMYHPLGVITIKQTSYGPRVHSERLPMSPWGRRFPTKVNMGGKPLHLDIRSYGSLIQNANHSLKNKATLVVPSDQPHLMALAYLYEKFLPLMVGGRPFK